MRLTRRDFGLLAAAVSVTPGVAQAAMPLPSPLIIAEGGAASERLEDTRTALDLAINEGCDFIQVNLVPTKEGALVARRDNELSATTDVAAHPEFAGRRTTKTIDGKPVTGWFAEDFTLPELKTLMCRERAPTLRPQNTRYDGKEPMLTIGEVLQLARDGCVRSARTIGVAARLIRPQAFAEMGLPVAERLADELNTGGYIAPAAAIWVQAYEAEALQTFARLARVRRMLMIDVAAAQTDGAGPAYTQQTTPYGLSQIRAYADGICADQDLVLDPNAAAFPAPTTLTLDAHSAGLTVFSRDARIENAFLPPQLRKGDRRSPNYGAGHGDVDRLLLSLFAVGLDGVSTDLIPAAGRQRDAAMDAIARAKSTGR